MHFPIADIAQRVGSECAILELRNVRQADHTFKNASFIHAEDPRHLLLAHEFHRVSKFIGRSAPHHQVRLRRRLETDRQGQQGAQGEMLAILQRSRGELEPGQSLHQRTDADLRHQSSQRRAEAVVDAVAKG
jgi:hypothetical protein